MAIIAFIFAALLGFIVRFSKLQPTRAWLIGCCVVPVFIYFTLGAGGPPGSRGAVYAVITVLGAAGSAAGVFLAGLLVRKK